jgi:uncharacterized protein
VRFFLRPVRNFIFHKVLHAEDTPHRVALGVAIGMFVASTPTVGAHMVLVVALAALLRANKVVGLPVVWVVNPVTIVPFYYSCWWLGAEILPGRSASGESVRDRLTQLTSSHASLWQDMLHLEFWTAMFRVRLSLGAELWVGCLIVGVVSGTVMYFVTRTLITRYRARRADRIMQSHERRRIRRAARAARTAAVPSPSDAV